MTAKRRPMLEDRVITGPNCADRAISTATGVLVQQMENSNVWLRAHHPMVCDGGTRPCTMHYRTQHHMRSWAQHWRSDRGIMERICPHGVGHPDPDDLPGDTTHGCDGCCHPPERRLRYLNFKPTHKINRKANHA